MIAEEISQAVYNGLPAEQRLKLALYSDFGDEAKIIYDWLTTHNEVVSAPHEPITAQTLSSDGVYYLYEDGTSELFDYNKANSPTKPVKRIGVVMGNHSLAINLNDYPEQPLTNQKDPGTTPLLQDPGNYTGYIKEYDNAVADWGGKKNTEHIRAIGTGIELKDDEWIPSVAELYLIYLNKRAINAAIALSNGEPLHDGWYWTSTEFSATRAWYLDLHDGCLYAWNDKVQSSGYVRAVAAFH